MNDKKVLSRNIAKKTPKSKFIAALSAMLMCSVLCFSALNAYAQSSNVITGTVKDNTGETVPGALVVATGTTLGATTNLDGMYSISVPANAQSLTFSYLGMISKEVPINAQTVINVTLEPDLSLSVDEVVVTALGIRKESKSLSYHVQQVTGDQINSIANANFVNNLDGRIAGVTINSSSVGAGGSSRVVMRGTKSLSHDNNVLYVVDGIPLPNLSYGQPSGVFEGAGQSGDGISNINPDDIESISALTGPSAAALYGSVGANGVVLITTKKGSKDKTSLSVSNSTIFSAPLVLPEFQNTYGPSETGSYYSWGEKLATPSSYRPRDFFRTGVSISNNVSLSTGTDRNQTYVSAGSINSEGIIDNNKYDRYNFSFRNTASFLDQKMTLDLGYMLGIVTEQNMLAQGQYINPLIPIYLFPPGDDFSKVEIYQRYDPSRNLQTQFWPYDAGFAMQNPYWITNKINNINKKIRHIATAALKYEILDWLNVVGRIRMDSNNERSEIKRQAGTSAPLFASKTGFYQLRNRANRNIYGDVIASFNKDFCTFDISANIGASFEDINYLTDVYGGNLASVANLFTYTNIDAARAYSDQNGSYRRNKQSVFATAQVGFMKMLYLDMSVRNDWSSTFAGSDTPSMFYPSVGLSGILTEMFPSIKNRVLSFARLRASYTEVGNEPAHFLTIPTYPMGKGMPVTETRGKNPDLKPELTKSVEAGLNLLLFGKKINLDATAYYSRTFSQFFSPELPPSDHLGANGITVNGGRVDNQGIELAAAYKDKVGNFSWNPYVTFTLNRNKVVELLRPFVLNNETISLGSVIDMGGTDSYRMRLIEGGTMGDIYVNTLKVDEHGAIYVHPTGQNVVADANTFVYAGNSAPRYNISAGTSLGWKNLTLDVMVTGRLGGIVVSNTQAILDRYGVSKATADARDNGGVIINGRSIPAQSYYEIVGGGTSGIGSMYVYDATNWRLNEVKLSYDLPVYKWCDWMQSATVSVVGRNLWVFYLKAPFDPQVTANTGTYYQGIDYFMTPSQRNVGFAVKLQF